ncbi:hypothetical protein KCU88_g195, partial [Aureobasidium melanogenum]
MELAVFIDSSAGVIIAAFLARLIFQIGCRRIDVCAEEGTHAALRALGRKVVVAVWARRARYSVAAFCVDIQADEFFRCAVDELLFLLICQWLDIRQRASRNDEGLVLVIASPQLAGPCPQVAMFIDIKVGGLLEDATIALEYTVIRDVEPSHSGVQPDVCFSNVLAEQVGLMGRVGKASWVVANPHLYTPLLTMGRIKAAAGLVGLTLVGLEKLVERVIQHADDLAGLVVDDGLCFLVPQDRHGVASGILWVSFEVELFQTPIHSPLGRSR